MYTKIHKMPTGHQPCKRIRTLKWVRDPTEFINQSVICLRHKSKQPLREALEQIKECNYITTSHPSVWNVLHTYVRSNERHKIFIRECTQISSRRTAVQRSWIVAGSSLSNAQEGPSARHVSREIFDAAARSPTAAYDPADRRRVNRRCRLDSAMYDVSSGYVVCRASTVQTRDWSSAAGTGHGATCTDRFPTHGDARAREAAAGTVVFVCRPPLMPVSMDITDIDMSTIRSLVLSVESDVVPPGCEQSFGGGGGGGGEIC